MLKELTKYTIIGFLFFLLFLIACKKEKMIEPDNNADDTIQIDTLSKSKIDYSIIVTSMDNAEITKKSLSSAKIIIVSENDTLQKNTNEDGIATFSSLNPGVFVVLITKPDYTPVKIRIKLSNSTDEPLNASTMVSLFNIKETNTLKGYVYAQLNVTINFKPWSVNNTDYEENKELEKIPDNVDFWASIDNTSLRKGISSDSLCEVIDFVYEKILFKGITLNGRFEIKVPVSNTEIVYNLWLKEGLFPIKYSSKTYYSGSNIPITDEFGNYVLETKTEEHLFSSASFQVSILGFNNIFYTEDIVFEYKGGINDDAYFGTIY